MMRIWLALGAFAGIRPYEARRVEWEMILFDKNKMVIPKTKSKTSLPRTIPPEVRDACPFFVNLPNYFKFTKTP